MFRHILVREIKNEKNKILNKVLIKNGTTTSRLSMSNVRKSF